MASDILATSANDHTIYTNCLVTINPAIPETAQFLACQLPTKLCHHVIWHVGRMAYMHIDQMALMRYDSLALDIEAA